MGQTSSGSSDGALVDFAALQGRIHRHAANFREVASLTYDNFVRAVDEVNRTSLRFPDASGKYLIFKVRPGTDTTLLWKGTVRIDCIKVDKADETESVRQLNISQFLQVRKIVLCQTNATTSSQPTDNDSYHLTASMILNSVGAAGESLDECCICMERKPDVILPCAHNYCLPCIEQWNVSHKTCPVCRETVESTDDTWVVSEKPDSAEVSAEIHKVLVGMSDAEET